RQAECLVLSAGPPCRARSAARWTADAGARAAATGRLLLSRRPGGGPDRGAPGVSGLRLGPDRPAAATTGALAAPRPRRTHRPGGSLHDGLRPRPVRPPARIRPPMPRAAE